MSTERFPRAKFVRQLSDLYDELGAWRSAYHRQAHYTEDQLREARLSDRVAVIEDLQVAVEQLIERLEFFPRLS